LKVVIMIMEQVLFKNDTGSISPLKKLYTNEN